jgi:alginate O-acetyltransferase complex protein AlgJ
MLVFMADRTGGAVWKRLVIREEDGAGPDEEEFVPAELVANDSVVIGRDGWLFLAKDTLHVLAQHSGELLLDREALDRWAALLERRKRLLAERGIEYLLLIAPDTHSVYPDKLPPGASHQEHRRPVVMLLDHLAERNCPVQPIYPLAELRETRAVVDVCSRLDTHWNDVGAFVAYSRLAEEMERLVPMRRLREDDVAFVMRPTKIGELGFKIHVEEKEIVPIAELRNQSAKLIRDNRVQNTGSVLSTACPEAPGSCVLWGDSYSWTMLKYLAESFGRCTFVCTPTLDLEFLEQERPDVVVNLQAERHLIRVPDDEKGRTVAELAARKLSSRAMRRRAAYAGLPWQ